jgi:hypothetical protein
MIVSLEADSLQALLISPRTMASDYYMEGQAPVPALNMIRGNHRGLPLHICCYRSILILEKQED